MGDSVAATHSAGEGPSLFGRMKANRWRLILFGFLLFLLLASSSSRQVLMESMADAFLAVSVFVAATLALVFWLERAFSFNLGQVMANNRRLQPLIASALGVLPGCGGAIIVVTQFTKGYASFGALISVLVATMGDAAFLLIARDPTSAVIVFSLSLVAGIITGWIADAIHDDDFMMVERDKVDGADAIDEPRFGGLVGERVPNVYWLWIALVAVGLVAGIFLAFLVEVDEWFGPWASMQPTLWLGFIGAGLSITLWAFSKRPISAIGADSRIEDPLVTRVVKDTNFVTAWVVLAFVSFELLVVFGGVDLGEMFKGFIFAMPTIAILIGFIPGCGPQIVVTSLYLAGAIPMSAQLANAIANDGDALFPALALAPRAAILATLYSAIPAFIIGYGWMFLVGT